MAIDPLLPFDFERKFERNEEAEFPFQAPLTDSAPGIPLTPRQATLAVPMAARECPKCHAVNSIGLAECRSCGIVFEQYNPHAEAKISQELELAGRTDLIFSWNETMERYLEPKQHESFLDACVRAQNLPYAASKYDGILSVAPQDETARSMRNRIVGLAGVHLDGASPVLSTSTWQMPLPSFNNFILFLGTIAAIVGLGLPASGDIAKVGFAVMALSLGLRFFLRRPV